MNTPAAAAPSPPVSESPQPSAPAAPPAKTGRFFELFQRPFPVSSLALTTLCLFAWVSVVYITRAVLLPLVLAMLVSYLLAPIVRLLGRAHIRPLFGSGLVLLAALGGTGYMVTLLAAPAMGWMEKAPAAMHQLQQTLVHFKRPMQRVTDATAAIEKMTTDTTGPTHSTQMVEVKHHTVADFFLNQTPELLAEILTTLILLYFLMAYDGLFLGKLIKVLPKLGDKKRAVTITREIEQSISRYLLTVTCINACLGLAVGTAVGLLGMPNPVLWGVMAMVFNFIPYLGATAGMIAMLLAALISFPMNPGWAFLMPGVYLAIAILEGNFITPMILGHSLTLNPIVIIMALMFWGWMWGIAGAILAVPILAAFKILCDHIEPLAPVGEFLST